MLEKLQSVPAFTAALALLLMQAPLGNALLQGTPKKPDIIQLTSDAWKAFDQKKYAHAIEQANRCIEDYQDQATRDETGLEDKAKREKTEPPPVGKVSEQQKAQIFAQGVVNDVATCLWIKGRSSQEMGQMDQAKQAYDSACKYKYARTWDPNGWFWSPSQDACDRLKRLNSK